MKLVKTGSQTPTGLAPMSFLTSAIEPSISTGVPSRAGGRTRRLPGPPGLHPQRKRPVVENCDGTGGGVVSSRAIGGNDRCSGPRNWPIHADEIEDVAHE